MNQEHAVFEAISRLYPQPRDWYRLHDVDRSSGAIRTSPGEAEAWNKDGWGIFHTVNAFSGPRRAEFLASINSWAVDIDCVACKPLQLAMIKRAPLAPSLVVETKGGFHVYWHARNARPESYETVVGERLIPFFKADPKAKDVSRLFRVPGFFHRKDPSDPFLVKVAFWSQRVYTEAEMLYAFKPPRERRRDAATKSTLRRQFGTGLWQRVYQLDCVDALSRLSGTHYVQREAYTFRRVGSGNLNIYVNGKSTSCFIDKDRRIGSLDGGGPTVANWLKWYGRSWSEVVAIMRLVFPELFDSGEDQSPEAEGR